MIPRSLLLLAIGLVLWLIPPLPAIIHVIGMVVAVVAAIWLVFDLFAGRAP